MLVKIGEEQVRGRKQGRKEKEKYFYKKTRNEIKDEVEVLNYNKQK